MVLLIERINLKTKAGCGEMKKFIAMAAVLEAIYYNAGVSGGN